MTLCGRRRAAITAALNPAPSESQPTRGAVETLAREIESRQLPDEVVMDRDSD